MKRCILAVMLALLVPAWAGAPAAEAPSREAVQTAVNRALPLLQKSAAEYTRQRGCFACHHQALSTLPVVLARQHGYEIDAPALQEQLRFTRRSLEGGRDGYRQGKGQGGAVDTAGYALWTLETGGVQPDDLTAAVSEYLLLRNADLDHWRASGDRPPSEGSRFTSTFLALRALQAFGTAEQKERVAARVAKVKPWLLQTPAVTTEDRVFRLWALKYAAAAAADLAAAGRELAATQREDGGWAQTDGAQSDAYATGSALLALHETGRLEPGAPAFQRGVGFLVRTQKPDGSWFVPTRSKPFQPYFESGFPYGKDQFISMAGTGWATAALILSGGGKRD